MRHRERTARTIPPPAAGGVEHVPFALAVLDADLVVSAANARALAVAATDGRDPVGLPFLTGPLAAGWTPPVAPLVGMAAGTGAIARGVHRNRATGAREVVTVTPVHDDAGHVAGMSVMAQPADAAAEEVERLGTRVRFLEGVLDRLPVPVLAVDAATGVVLAVSTVLADLLGVRTADLVGERTPLWFMDAWDPGDPRPPAAVTLRPRRGGPARMGLAVSETTDGRGRTVRVAVLTAQPSANGFEGGPGPEAARALVAALSPRRRQVLRLLCDGLDTEAIAARLVISEHTARNHVQAVLRHLDCRSRLQAVALAHRAGLCGER